MIESTDPLFKHTELTPQAQEPAPEPRVPTMKELDSWDQPRERAKELGIQALRTSELLAIILRTGSSNYPVTHLARDLMRANGDRLQTLARRSRKELCMFKGIGLTKAIQIEAVMELIRRHNSEDMDDAPVVGNSMVVYDLLRNDLAHLGHEEMWAVFVNRANRVIKKLRLSVGGINSTLFDVRILMKDALLEQASGIILVHNHPSGALEPSKEDDKLTQLAANACKLMDLRLLDHLVICGSRYFSYADNGRI